MFLKIIELYMKLNKTINHSPNKVLSDKFSNVFNLRYSRGTLMFYSGKKRCELSPGRAKRVKIS